MIPANRDVPLRPDPATSTIELAIAAQSRGAGATAGDDYEKFAGSPRACPNVAAVVAIREPEAPFVAHVQTHTVVLPRQRVLFLPMPKAACTSMLWTLAELAGISPDAFAGSTLPEPSASLTVHDVNAWAPEHRLAQNTGDARRRILHDDGWLRFTVVRDPWRRLWSAWL